MFLSPSPLPPGILQLRKTDNLQVSYSAVLGEVICLPTAGEAFHSRGRNVITGCQKKKLPLEADEQRQGQKSVILHTQDTFKAHPKEIISLIILGSLVCPLQTVLSNPATD